MSKLEELKRKAVIAYRESQARAAADKAYRKEYEEKEYMRLKQKKLRAEGKAKARQRMEGNGGFFGSLQGISDSMIGGPSTKKGSKKQKKDDIFNFRII